MISLAEILHKPENMEIARQVHENLEKELSGVEKLWLPNVNEDDLERRLENVAGMVNDFLDIYPPLPNIKCNRYSMASSYISREKCISLSVMDM
ncbi:MAG: hypothetical protein V1734_04540, partial [Nanoarchaeota archaeon]